jgi:hypothetical protein
MLCTMDAPGNGLGLNSAGSARILHKLLKLPFGPAFTLPPLAWA